MRRLARLQPVCRGAVLGRGASTSSDPSGNTLYETHVRLGFAERAALAAGSALGALVRPERADLVAAFGYACSSLPRSCLRRVLSETTGTAALEGMRRRMAADPVGARLLRERPRITDATLAACWASPPASFGAAYAGFMGVRSFAPRDRPPVRFVDDEELAYVAARAREVHDLWHVLFGCSTTIAGELRLKAVEAVQTGLPSAALAALVAPLRLSGDQQAAMLRHGFPWALRAGSQAVDLMCIHYELHFEEALDLCRARWRITPWEKPT